MIVKALDVAAFAMLAGGLVWWRSWVAEVRERRSVRRVQRTVWLVRTYY